MAFSDFTYPDVLAQFGLTYVPADDMFAGVPPLALTDWYRQMLPTGLRLATVGGEKVRSELLVAPLLADLWGRYHGRIGMYSGEAFNADPAAGLNGFVDFMLCRSPQQPVVGPPVLVAFEAKGGVMTTGYGQCVAAMIGAQRYNRRHGVPTDPIYGCVTTGTTWRFARLTGTTFSLDLTEYTIDAADRILGILASILGPIPDAVTAA